MNAGERAELFAEEARSYAARGWSTVRVEGKRAKGEHWEQTLPDPPEVAAGKWSRWGRRWNIGVVCGPSGLAVLDVDVDDDPDRAALDLLGVDEFPRTPIVRTGSGKLQIYFADPGGLRKVARDGFELRVGAHMCVLPPSEHPDTRRPYEWEQSPDEVQLQPLPARLIEHFNARREGKLAEPLPKTIGRGGRHANLLSLAGSMRQRGLTAEEMLPTLRVWNERHCDPPKTEDELRVLAEDVASRYRPEPPDPEQEQLEREADRLFADWTDEPFDGARSASDQGRSRRERRAVPLIVALAEFLGGDEGDAAWLVDHLAARGALVIVAGLPKVGKSTFVYGMLGALTSD